MKVYSDNIELDIGIAIDGKTGKKRGYVHNLESGESHIVVPAVVYGIASGRITYHFNKEVSNGTKK